MTVNGVDIHPGFATGKLVNAARLAGRMVAALPSDRLTPETTSGREGFIHPYALDGDGGHGGRSARSCATSTTSARRAHRPAPRTAGGSSPPAARAARRHGQAAVPEHAGVPRRRPGGRRARRAGDPAEGIAPRAQADPRRHRRLGPQRARPADAEHLHRRPRVPLRARVGVVQDMASASAVIVRLAEAWAAAAGGSELRHWRRVRRVHFAALSAHQRSVRRKHAIGAERRNHRAAAANATKRTLRTRPLNAAVEVVPARLRSRSGPLLFASVK